MLAYRRNLFQRSAFWHFEVILRMNTLSYIPCYCPRVSIAQPSIEINDVRLLLTQPECWLSLVSLTTSMTCYYVTCSGHLLAHVYCAATTSLVDRAFHLTTFMHITFRLPLCQWKLTLSEQYCSATWYWYGKETTRRRRTREVQLVVRRVK